MERSSERNSIFSIYTKSQAVAVHNQSLLRYRRYVARMLKIKTMPNLIAGIVYANSHPFCQSIIISCRDRQRISHVAFLLSIHLQAAKQSYSFYIEKSKNDYKPNLYPTESVSV